MKIIYNDFIPFKGFRAINIFGVVFVRGKRPISATIQNHEAIHTAQMREMLWLIFYVVYFVEWLFRLFRKGNAYRQISFEREAYENQDDRNYLCRRRRFAQWRKTNGMK